MNVAEKIDNEAYESFLSFGLGKEVFSIGVEKVIEILEVPKITNVPRSPDYMAGVINLRGNVLPLVDTRIKFGLQPIQFDENTCIIVMEIKVDGEIINVGALVDSVLEVMEVDANNIQPSPSIDEKYKLEFIKGMITTENGFIMLLNLDEVFSIQDVQIMQGHNGTVETKETKK